jgi:hypothetical protein
MDTQDTIEYIKEFLEPYIKPREQVSHIRRILSLHLQSFTDRVQPGGPLALVDESVTATVTKQNRGLEREYLKALAANLKARREFETVRKAHSVEPASRHPAKKKHGHAEKLLEDQLALIKLRQKTARLETLHKHLDILNRQPAASDQFLDLETIFAGCRPLPRVPRTIVDSFAVAGSGAGRADLSIAASQLDKVLLRSKLLLRREEQLLEEVKSRSVIDTTRVDDGTKLHALEITRDELIQWIETELSNASGQEAPDTGGGQEPDEEGGRAVEEEQKQKAAKKEILNRLDEVRAKYEHYVASRKALIMALEQPRPSPKLSTMEPADSAAVVPPAREPIDHLLIPYLDSLLALSREQKGLISHKSHFNVTIAKQLKEGCQTIDHLAAESQLLPKFGAASASQGLKRGGLMDDLSLGASERPDLSSRVRPWAVASDSAKIATLEEVAEKIEEGQVAIEGSMAAVAEIDRLLGKGEQKQVDKSAEEAEDDVWLETDQGSGRSQKKRQVDKKKRNTTPDGKVLVDIWSVLDGRAGLTGQESHP